MRRHYGRLPTNKWSRPLPHRPAVGRQEDVPRLEVPVGDAGSVEGAEPLGAVASDLEPLCSSQGAVVEGRLEIASGHERSDDAGDVAIDGLREGGVASSSDGDRGRRLQCA